MAARVTKTLRGRSLADAMSPAKGPRRWRKHALLSEGKLTAPPGYSAKDRSKKIKNMMQTLSVRGWVFCFSVDATSPNGFHYAAEGVTADEAFLKAFSLWNGKLAEIPKIAKIRIIAGAPRSTESVHKEYLRKYHRARNGARQHKRDEVIRLGRARKEWDAGYLRSAQEKKPDQVEPKSWGGVLRASWEKRLVAA